MVHVKIFGNQFIFDDEKEFAVKEKISATGDNFGIVDQDGRKHFQGDGKYFSTREKIILEDGHGKAIATLQSKHLSLHGKYYLCRGDSDDDENRLFVFRPSHTFNAFNALTGTVDVLDAESDERKFYIKRIEGVANKTYGVFKDGNDKQVGTIARDQGFGGWITDRDHYRVTVPQGVDAAFILSCALITDEVREEDD